MSIMDDLDRKFTSGNAVPVTRSSITIGEYESLRLFTEELNSKLDEAMDHLDSETYSYLLDKWAEK